MNALLKEIVDELKVRSKINPLLLHSLMPMQSLFVNCPSKIKVALGGNRSGKSEGGAYDVLSEIIKSDKSLRVWCCGLTFSDSVNIQQRKIWELLPKNRVTYARYNPINGFSNRKIEFDNGTLMVFKSYDQGFEAFQGDDVDIIWLDEEPPKEIWDECKMRLIDRSGRLILTMTSLKGITNLVEEVFENYIPIKVQYAKDVNKDLPRIAEKGSAKIFFLWTPENIYINQQRLKDEIKTMDVQERLCRIFGMPINLAGRIYPKFSKDIHVISRNDLDLNNCQIWQVTDPHDRKPWAMIWAAVHKTGSVCIFDEYPNIDFNSMLYDDKTYDDYASLIKNKEIPILKIVSNKYVKRILDPNFGTKTIQLAERQGGQSKTTPKEQLRKRGLFYDDGIDSLEAGHIQVKEYLHWETKKGSFTVSPKIFITDNCINTISQLSKYSYRDIETADGDIRDGVKPKEKYKDFPDCVRYLVMANPRYIVQQEYETNERKVY